MTDSDNALSTKKYSVEMLTQGDCTINLPFLIPIYQRLYTWEHLHVERLLADLWAAYEAKQPEYFIGAVVVSPANANPINEYQALELIDGQQRMTTLWLIASVFVTHKALTADNDSLLRWKKFMALGDGSSSMARLDFSGREQDKVAVKSFIKNWCCDCHAKSCGSNCNGWLKNEAMAVARSTISHFLDRKQYEKIEHSETQNIAGNISDFSTYIWSNATFVITRLHAGTDKNRFFDTMNSRGIQLEKHEILKAKLLNGMDEPSRQRYAKIWDLCADINGYIPSEYQEKFDYGRIPLDEGFIKNVIETSSPTQAQEQDDFTLEAILSNPESDSQSELKDKKRTKAYKSVVAFPVFLLHVLRVFVCDQEPTAISVDDKNLISRFEENLTVENKPFGDKSLCKNFIICLLECRLLLDNFVIKGHVDEGSEFARWEIFSQLAGKKSDTLYKRTGQTWDSIAMLQTMMYFSQDTTRAPWLTGLLKGLREEKETKVRLATVANGKQLLAQLQQQDKEDAKKRLYGNTLEKIVGAEGKGLGTKVPHYWFFKLEYCLWELWFNKNQTICACVKPPLLINKKSSFRMRHVTSIEHVSPQSRNNGNITDSLLNRFGNLVLISVGANSSYSDKDPSVKAAEFTLKLDKGMIESLKLAHIFKNGSGDDLRWNDDDLKAHETAMLAVLKAFHPELEKNNTCAQEDNDGH